MSEGAGSVLGMTAMALSGPEEPLGPLGVLRAAVSAATTALGGLGRLLALLPASDLTDLLSEVDRLAAVAAGARVAIAGEGVERGLAAASQAGSTRDWIRAHAPSLTIGPAGQIAAVLRACQAPDQRVELSDVMQAVTTGAVTVPAAVQVLSDYAKLREELVPHALPAVLDNLLVVAAVGGPAEVARQRPALLARHGDPGRLDREQTWHATRLHGLSTPVGDDITGWTYRWQVDAATKAMVEAGIAALSRPQPEPDGAPDRRSNNQRRSLALAALLRRGAAASTSGGTGAATTTLFVTIDLADLCRGLTDQWPGAGVVRVGAGTVLGSPAAGTLLSAGTVRRLACDAAIIPAVLGGPGQILDFGRQQRLVTPALRKFLVLRDRGCTFPGCSTPASFTDAHHIRHWLAGGTTDPDNLTLLCERHHTVVHRDALTATVSPAGVTWRHPDGIPLPRPRPPRPGHSPPTGPQHPQRTPTPPPGAA